MNWNAALKRHSHCRRIHTEYPETADKQRTKREIHVLLLTNRTPLNKAIARSWVRRVLRRARFNKDAGVFKQICKGFAGGNSRSAEIRKKFFSLTSHWFVEGWTRCPVASNMCKLRRAQLAVAKFAKINCSLFVLCNGLLNVVSTFASAVSVRLNWSLISDTSTQHVVTPRWGTRPATVLNSIWMLLLWRKLMKGKKVSFSTSWTRYNPSSPRHTSVVSSVQSSVMVAHGVQVVQIVVGEGHVGRLVVLAWGLWPGCWPGPWVQVLHTLTPLHYIGGHVQTSQREMHQGW